LPWRPITPASAQRNPQGGLGGQGFDVLDLGTDNTASVDYPDFADRMAAALAQGRARAGRGLRHPASASRSAANRHRHVRAALCTDTTAARLARQHNDANVLALASRA